MCTIRGSECPEKFEKKQTHRATTTMSLQNSWWLRKAPSLQANLDAPSSLCCGNWGVARRETFFQCKRPLFKSEARAKLCVLGSSFAKSDAHGPLIPSRITLNVFPEFGGSSLSPSLCFPLGCVFFCRPRRGTCQKKTHPFVAVPWGRWLGGTHAPAIQPPDSAKELLAAHQERQAQLGPWTARFCCVPAED